MDGGLFLIREHNNGMNFFNVFNRTFDRSSRRALIRFVISVLLMVRVTPFVDEVRNTYHELNILIVTNYTKIGRSS